MNIQVLGAGCTKCKRLFLEVEKAIANIKYPVTLSKIEDLEQIIRYGICMTPALIIDGEIKSTGRVPSVSEIQKWMNEKA